MKKVFYWSPYLSNVATINNVINSAISLTKYSRNYAVSFIDVIGEWVNSEKILSKNNIDIKKLNSLILDLPKIGFIKSRIYSILIFLFNIDMRQNMTPAAHFVQIQSVHHFTFRRFIGLHFG